MTGIAAGNKMLEIVDQYVYLGLILSFGKDDQMKEIARRIQLSNCTTLLSQPKFHSLKPIYI